MLDTIVRKPTDIAQRVVNKNAKEMRRQRKETVQTIKFTIGTAIITGKN